MLKQDWTKVRQEVWGLKDELDKDVVCGQTLAGYFLKDLEASKW